MKWTAKERAVCERFADRMLYTLAGPEIALQHAEAAVRAGIACLVLMQGERIRTQHTRAKIAHTLRRNHGP